MRYSGSDGKESACNEGDPGFIAEWGRLPGEGDGYPCQYLAWKIPGTEESGGLQVRGVTKTGTQLNDEHFSLQKITQHC